MFLSVSSIGRAGEPDERRVRQGLAHVPGEAVDEVVLAAVGFVGDDHDVPPVRQERVLVLAFGREELLDRREDHAAGGRLSAVPADAPGSSACTGCCRSSSWHRANVPKSWSSRSLRSVMTTSVGFSIAGCSTTRPA